MNWEQMIWDAMCALYQKMGGNCADLPVRPPNPVSGMNSLPDVIDALEARFNSLGIPAFGSPAERQSFLDALTNVETLLNKPTNSLPSDADTQLRNLIAAMRAAVP